MIVNYEYLNGKLIVSYINKRGQMQFKNYNWPNPLEWKICSPTDPQKSDNYHTWDKKPVKLEATRYPSRYAIYEYLMKLPQNEKDDIFTYNEPKLFFCDIEVEITDGFPEAHIADNKVTSMCFIHNNKILLLGIKDITNTEVLQMELDINEYLKSYNTDYKIEWYFCKTEYELLSYFFNDLIKNIPVLTGWNFIDYDWVYLVTRARKLGINPNVASPTGKLIKPWKKTENIQKPTFEELPKHRLIVDYMNIFDKWDTSIKIKESISLDFVANKILGVKKLEYAGTLKELYEKDYYKYLLYNCIDTALVQLIHNKQRTFDIMLAISNLAKIPIEDSPSAIRVTEGILFEKYHQIGIVMTKQKHNISTTDIDIDIDIEVELSGGYVKYPATGLKQWVTVFDFASLYPTTMRQFNIAPESYTGIKIDNNYALLNGSKYEIQPNDIILLNNTVFKNEDSETKHILTSIFIDRKKHKNLGLDYKKQYNLIKSYYNNKFNKK